MKFLVGPIAVLVWTLFATAGTSSAQISTISEPDFLTSNRGAYRATAAKYPRREIRTYEQLSNGIVTSSYSELLEFLAVDKYRVKEVVVSKGKTTISEDIQVGEIRYCRKDSSAWEMYCPEPPPAAALGSIAGAQYSLEIGTDTKTYQRIYQSSREDKEKSKAISFTTTDKIVLNSDSSHRDRSIITTNLETKEIVSRLTVKVEYGVKVDPIVAPIK
jgi:hypothetical protein